MIWPDENTAAWRQRLRYEQIIMEETTRAGCGSGSTPCTVAPWGPYFENFGNEEQRERFLPGCVKGDTIPAVP